MRPESVCRKFPSSGSAAPPRSQGPPMAYFPHDTSAVPVDHSPLKNKEAMEAQGRLVSGSPPLPLPLGSTSDIPPPCYIGSPLGPTSAFQQP